MKGQSLADSTLPIGQPYPIISGGKANAANQPTGNSCASDSQPAVCCSDRRVPYELNVLLVPACLPACRSLCLPSSLDPAKVKGKIVVCVRGVNARAEKGFVVKQAGGVGMVLCNDASTGDTVVADAHVLAAAHCSYSQCVRLFNYLQSTK
jgi:hypothetical protein